MYIHMYNYIICGHNIGRGRSPTNAISTITKGSHQMAFGRGCGGETTSSEAGAAVKFSKSEADRYAYRRACRRANKLINASRRDYFRSWLSSATDCKERWKIAKEVFHSTRTVHERSTDELKQLCMKFAVYFVDKICSLKASIAATLVGENPRNWRFSAFLSRWVGLGPWFKYRWMGGVSAKILSYHSFRWRK